MSKSNLLRISQINAIYLDNEIYKAFVQIINDASRNLPPGFIAPFERELNLLVRVAILNYSILKNGSTFGQQLLAIKYDNMTTLKGILYVIGSCLDYVRTKFEVWKPSHDLNKVFSQVYTVLKLLEFVNLTIFLGNGVKPQLIERLLGLNQVYASDSVQRQYESKYMARELLWNGFIEILMYVLPLINYHKIKRTIRNYNPFHKRPSYSNMQTTHITMHSKCAHCGENPIIPHHMGCAHIFCYVCLKGNQAADSKYECPICEHRNPNLLCDRVTVI